MQPIRVLLVDDSSDFLDAASQLLNGHPRLQVVGRASSGWEGVRLAAELRPHLVLMDVHMPVMSGLTATRLIKSRHAPPAVVIVSMYDQEEARENALACLADGFISKQQFAEELESIAQSLFAGHA